MIAKKPKVIKLLDRDGAPIGTSTLDTVNRLLSKGLIEERVSPLGHTYWVRTLLGEAVVDYGSGGALH